MVSAWYCFKDSLGRIWVTLWTTLYVEQSRPHWFFLLSHLGLLQIIANHVAIHQQTQLEINTFNTATDLDMKYSTIAKAQVQKGRWYLEILKNFWPILMIFVYQKNRTYWYFDKTQGNEDSL